MAGEMREGDGMGLMGQEMLELSSRAGGEFLLFDMMSPRAAG